MVYFAEKRCYSYYIKDSEKDLQVKFETFSGLYTYFINPIKIPTNDSQALYKNFSMSSSSLRITARERKINRYSKGLHYICIFGHITSTYSILVHELDAA